MPNDGISESKVASQEQGDDDLCSATQDDLTQDDGTQDDSIAP